MRAAWLIGLVACGSAEPPAKQEPDRGLVFERQELMERLPGNQQTTNVRLAPLGWGAPVELVITETNPPVMHWMGCGADGCALAEVDLPEGLIPARSATADMDGDGDGDLVVASIGDLRPTNDRVGSIWIGWNDGGALTFEQLAENMGRTVCAEPGDLDGDGDLDLTACVFGHVTVGVVGWLENTGDAWVKRILDRRPGAIHSVPLDVDADGDLDLVTVVAQLDEQVLLHRNDGSGGFTSEVLVDQESEWWGMSGLEPADLDGDGDVDLLVSNGDTMDGEFPKDELDPRDFHGVRWLENDGSGRFTSRLVGLTWGAYGVRAVDMDGDGDLDVPTVSLGMEQTFPELEPAPLVVFVNDGAQGFSRQVIPGAPPQLVTIEAADLDADGRMDLVVGSLEMEPDTRTTRLSAFFGR